MFNTAIFPRRARAHERWWSQQTRMQISSVPHTSFIYTPRFHLWADT